MQLSTLGIAQPETILTIEPFGSGVFSFHLHCLHHQSVARVQGPFDCILQQQRTESLSADGEGSREATDPHSTACIVLGECIDDARLAHRCAVGRWAGSTAKGCNPTRAVRPANLAVERTGSRRTSLSRYGSHPERS